MRERFHTCLTLVPNAEILLPPSAPGEALYEQVWQGFFDVK